jgi:hypothetical protein
MPTVRKLPVPEYSEETWNIIQVPLNKGADASDRTVANVDMVSKNDQILVRGIISSFMPGNVCNESHNSST